MDMLLQVLLRCELFVAGRTNKGSDMKVSDFNMPLKVEVCGVCCSAAWIYALKSI
jgi:hypothetical protein